MRRENWRVTLKRTVKKKIEERQGQKKNIFISGEVIRRSTIKPNTNEKPKPTLISNSMNERDKLRIFGNKINPKTNTKLISYGTYNKKIGVDFDVVFCVSSFDRYDKIKRILEQIFSQETKYTFKFILLNDGSTDKRYSDLKNMFPDILYLKNAVVGGKINYWRTINTMWKKASEFNTYAIIQLDDDFILCNNFLNILLDTFFEIKDKCNDYMIFGFHIYGFKKDEPIHPSWLDENERVVDGGMLLDVQFMKMINYEFDEIEHRVTLATSSFTWVRLKEKIIELGVKVYRFKNSLVWHAGNEDSKLHPTVRKGHRVYTKNFIDKDIINYEQYD
jgi:hypothetical protein